MPCKGSGRQVGEQQIGEQQVGVQQVGEQVGEVSTSVGRHHRYLVAYRFLNPKRNNLNPKPETTKPEP